MYSLIASVIVSLTNMSNISVINWSSCLEFLGDYEIKSVEMKSGSELSGEAIMRLLIDNEEYELRVSMKEGKKEGIGVIVREDGTLYMRMMFVNDECEGNKVKKNKYGKTVLKGRVEKGKEVGMWIEYDDYGNETWRGLYRNGDKVISLKEYEGMSGLWREVNDNGELLSVSEYDEYGLLKNGKCFEYEGGRLVRECEYKNGVMMRVLREWKGECMIEYDVNGMRVYEGGFEGDMMKGFVREGEGKEYGIDGKSALYVGGWKNGLRDGYGSEFHSGSVLYIGEWKNGLKHGMGEEYDENEDIVRKGEWTNGIFGIKVFSEGYNLSSNITSFDGKNYLQNTVYLDIRKGCFTSVSRFVIDELNELEGVIIGEKCLSCRHGDMSNIELEGECLIRSCKKLREITIGSQSFCHYGQLVLNRLPSLESLTVASLCFSKNVTFSLKSL